MATRPLEPRRVAHVPIDSSVHGTPDSLRSRPASPHHRGADLGSGRSRGGGRRSGRLGSHAGRRHGPRRRVRPRNRSAVQRATPSSAGLSLRAPRGDDPVSGARGVRGRSDPRRDPGRRQRRVRHQPPQQHGLRARGVPGRGARRAELCGRRMGARLAARHAHPIAWGVLRAARLAEPSLSQGARAVRAARRRPRRHAGPVPRRRAVARRPAAAAEAGTVVLCEPFHVALGAAGPDLRPGRAQLRSRAGGSHPAAGPRSRRATPLHRAHRVGRGGLGRQEHRPLRARPAAPVRVCVRQLRPAAVAAEISRRARRGSARPSGGGALRRNRTASHAPHGRDCGHRAGYARQPRGDRAAQFRGGRGFTIRARGTRDGARRGADFDWGALVRAARRSRRISWMSGSGC